MTGAVVTIQVARDAVAQQTALSDWLAALPDVGYRDGNRQVAAVIAEGTFAVLTAPASVVVERIAAGCVCCVGQIAMRVTLTRLLRAHRPKRLLLLLASGEHIDRVRRMLGDEQFATVLRLQDPVHDAGSR